MLAQFLRLFGKKNRQLESAFEFYPLPTLLVRVWRSEPSLSAAVDADGPEDVRHDAEGFLKSWGVGGSEIAAASPALAKNLALALADLERVTCVSVAWTTAGGAKRSVIIYPDWH